MSRMLGDLVLKLFLSTSLVPAPWIRRVGSGVALATILPLRHGESRIVRRVIGPPSS
jgi:hypothetical protein